VAQAEASPPGKTAEVEAAAPVLPPPPLQTAPPSSPPSAAPRDTAEVAAPSGGIESPAASARSAAAEAAVPAPSAVAEARLRAAAAAGRVSELTTLLGQGVLVDAADEVGDTALIKAVRANRQTAAALLPRYGADLELENRRGESARSIAASIGDPELTRALGPAP